jgi:hypothetical protein
MDLFGHPNATCGRPGFRKESRKEVDEDTYRALQSPDLDWGRITLELGVYALAKVRRRGWQTARREVGHSGDIEEGSPSLPRAKTVKDLVQGAVTKTLRGTRTWNREKHPALIEHLKSVIDSDVYTLVRCKEHRVMGTFPESEEGEALEELVTCAHSLDEHAVGTLPVAPPTPLDGSLTKEQLEADMELFNALTESIQGDVELTKMVDAILDGKEDYQDMEQHTGIPVKRLYKLREKLDRRARQAEVRCGRRLGQSRDKEDVS